MLFLGIPVFAFVTEIVRMYLADGGDDDDSFMHSFARGIVRE